MESNIDLNFDPTILYNKMETINSHKDDVALKKVCKEFESIF